MDEPLPAVIALGCFAGLAVLAAAGVVLRRIYWSEWAQEWVLRWTGSSRRVMTAWGPVIAGRTGKGRRWI